MFTDIWINHTLAARLLSTMLERVFGPPRSRPEGMLILSDSNNGKSHILKKVCHEVLSATKQPSTGMFIPAVNIQAPVNAIRKDLYSSLARALCIPGCDRMPAAHLRRRTIDAMSDAKVRMLCVDELHHLIPGGASRQRVILDDLKFISNELRIPIFAAGTAEASSLTAKDDQYSSRLPALHLPRWNLDKEYLCLLASIEVSLEAPVGSFTSKPHAELIWKHSRGLIGRVWKICESAGDKARLTDSGRITDCEINAAGFVDLPWLRK